MLTVTRTKQAVLVEGEELQGYKVGGSDTLAVVKLGNKWSIVEEGILVGELFPTMKAAVEAANTVDTTEATVVDVEETVVVDTVVVADVHADMDNDAGVSLVEAVDVGNTEVDVVAGMDNADNDMAGEEDMVVADVVGTVDTDAVDSVDTDVVAVDSAVVDVVTVADGVVVDAVVAVPSEDGDVVVLYVVADNPMVSMAVEYADGDSLLYIEGDSYEPFSDCESVYNLDGMTYTLPTIKDLLVSAGVDVPVSDNVVSNAVIDAAVDVAVSAVGIEYVAVVDTVAYADAYNVDVHDVVCYVVDAVVNTISDVVASTVTNAVGSMMDSIAYQLVFTNYALCTATYNTHLHDDCVHSIDCILTNRHHLDDKYHLYEHDVYCCTCDTAYMGIYNAPYSTCTNITYTQYVNAVYGICCDTNYTMKGGDDYIACIVLTSLYMVIGMPYKGVCAVDVSYEDDT